MKKLNYKMIVSDFDGTLIDDNQSISQNVKDKINEYVEAGGIFAVCTGRTLCSILPIVRSLGLKGLVIAMQGCVIADIESGRIIKCKSMDCVQVSEICKNIEELGHPINIYCGDDIYTDIPSDNVHLQLYEKIIGVKTKFVDKKISQFVLENKLDCQKVSSLVLYEQRDWLYGELLKRLGDRFDVTCSAKVLVEVSPLNETKGEAVKYLCNYFNLSIDECIAVGDNLNDLSMIEVAGLGVAVSNADEALKRVADFISISNNESALAQIIEKFGLA